MGAMNITATLRPSKTLFTLVLSLLVLTGCTPGQVETLTALFPVLDAGVLLGLPDRPARLPDGRVVELDGSVTVAPDRFVHPDSAVDRWFDVYLAAGFPVADWGKWSCRIYRESRGQPGVRWVFGRDESYGLLQINARAHRPAMVGFAGSVEAFYDPLVNLSFAHDLWVRVGDRPWFTASGSCR